jgi:2-polyprenyl-3-methyl-5-hydroxy-6-metoxy-1,4-benzoquinol methylase
VEKLLSSAGSALLIAGYESPSTSGSPMVYFHEPLSTTILRSRPDAELYPLRYDHEVWTFLVLLPSAERHPRDYSAGSLHDVIARHPCPLRLADVRRSAWRAGMFFADHAPRLLEYPLVAELVTSLAAPGAVVADIGAGVQPLVPYLTEHGYVVDTVDPSVTHRSFPVSLDCNEWGYLDYGSAGLARASYNTTLEHLPQECAYDIVMSVSVVEHLPGPVRRELLGEAVRRLRPGGALVLTVDITPGTDELWNRSEGAEVEPAGIHGDFSDFLEELRSVGLTIVGSEIVREWGNGPVDIGIVVARLA